MVFATVTNDSIHCSIVLRKFVGFAEQSLYSQKSSFGKQLALIADLARVSRHVENDL
jgi:hypothetical protein